MAKSAEQNGRDPIGDPALPQKKRARRRLVGAIALGLAAAVSLPLLLDSEPKREATDLKVQIPSRDAPVSGAIPGAVSGAASVRPTAPIGAAGVAQQTVPAAKSDTKSDTKPDGKLASKPDTTVDGSTDSQGDARAKAKERADKATVDKADKAAAEKLAKEQKLAADKVAKEAKAAKLEAAAKETKSAKGSKDGKYADKSLPKPSASANGKKYLLQVGAFSSDKGATDQADRVKAAGLRAFTEKVKTVDGERIRVRVGPFASRDEAEQARGQLKLSGIDAALIVP